MLCQSWALQHSSLRTQHVYNVIACNQKHSIILSSQDMYVITVASFCRCIQCNCDFTSYVWLRLLQFWLHQDACPGSGKCRNDNLTHVAIWQYWEKQLMPCGLARFHVKHVSQQELHIKLCQHFKAKTPNPFYMSRLITQEGATSWYFHRITGLRPHDHCSNATDVFKPKPQIPTTEAVHGADPHRSLITPTFARCCHSLPTWYPPTAATHAIHCLQLRLAAARPLHHAITPSIFIRAPVGSLLRDAKCNCVHVETVVCGKVPVPC